MAWANAPKLTVRLEYHGNWGSSNPVRGAISQQAGGSIDIRSGYDFSLEFTPAPAYSLTEWRVYATSELPSGWEDDTGLLDPDKQLDGVELPPVNPNGGTFTFKLNTTTPATLIPICVTQPRVIRTEPRDDPDSRYSRATPITIYFNAQMDPDTMLFETGFIEIKDDAGYDLKAHFIDPVYADIGGFHYAVINPNGENLPPFDTLIRVFAGENLKNIQGNEMANNAMSFAFRTIMATSENPTITSWSAVYGENATSGWIDINYAHNGGTRTEATYRENRIGPNAVPDNGRIPTGKLNADGIRQGIAASGIREYEVTIRVFEGQSPADTVTFRIWNVPGLSTNNNEQITIINEEMTNAQITALFADAAITNIVLIQDITLSNWTPVNLSNRNFYGNGHTVTIRSMNAAADMGLFGVVNGGMVRDLTVNYETAAGGAVTVTRTGEAQYGGIAGTMQGTARLENVLVKGAVSVSGNNNIFAGGLVGLMGRTAHCIASINNAYGGLNLTVFKTAGTAAATGSAYIGGIAGSMGNPNPSTATTVSQGGDPNAIGSAVRVEKVRVVRDITAGSSNTLFAGIIGIPGNQGTHLGIKLGGLVGHIYGAGNGNLRAVLNDCDYRQGSIRIYMEDASINMGGAVGSIFQYADITDCSSEGSIVIEKTDTYRT
ncbi:MAG: Ig-like domain-containing protein [Treponema sp.]|nr:Ig-like domain-containing protein [Treponema sp.]